MGEKENPKLFRYQTLISLMLSSQTKDEITSQSVKNLQKIGLNPKTISETDTQELEECIYPASFYKRKAIYIKETSKVLHEKYDDDIPNTIKELTKLKGVGPKMAYLAMSSCWNNVVGIG